MQIADYLGQYANSLANAASQGTPKASGNAVQNLVSTLTELQEGTVFEGSINAIDGSKILLGLGNGHTVAARLDGNVNLLLGQSVFFQVKSNDGNTIAIKPFADGKAFNPTIQKALDAAGMEMTKDTIDMVNRMMEEGMPIDRNALLAMRHTLAQNPQVSMSSAIAMSKLGIPVNEQMAAQFENYQNDRHMMLNQMEQVIGELPSAYAKVPGDEILQFNRQVLAIFGDGLPQDGDGGALFTDAPSGGALSDAIQASRDAQQALLEGLMENSKEGQMDNPMGGQIHNQPGNPAESLLEHATQGLRDSILADAVKNSMSATKDLLQDAKDIQETSIKGNATAAETSSQAGENAHRAGSSTISELLDRRQAAELETQLKEIFAQAKDIKLNTQLSSREFLDALARQLQETPLSGHKGALSKLLAGKEYQAILKDAIEQQWTLKPQELKEPHKIEDLYQRLDRQMAQIEQLAKQTGISANELSQSAQQVRNNIDFMNQINQAYTYVQIPLKMANQNAHSELYVYTNKRNLQKGGGELSAFLHLDMENLGSTDVSVKMLDKNISTKFYLADDDAYNLIEKHLPMLEERLAKLGYHCRISVENREEKVDFVEDFLQKCQPQKAASRGMVHRYSFDVRA